MGRVILGLPPPAAPEEVPAMARRCEICGKGIAHGNQVSHSNRKSRRIWSPNLQRVRAVTDRGVRRIRVCTTCLKSGRVVRAV